MGEEAFGPVKVWFPSVGERQGTEEENVVGACMHHNVHSSPVYNSQKLERTQMSFSSWMDTKIVVHLHNGVLLIYQKKWPYDILK